MIQTDDLLRTSQSHIARLHHEAEQRHALRGERAPLRLRLARTLHDLARVLDPTLTGEGRPQPLL